MMARKFWAHLASKEEVLMYLLKQYRVRLLATEVRCCLVVMIKPQFHVKLSLNGGNESLVWIFRKEAPQINFQ